MKKRMQSQRLMAASNWHFEGLDDVRCLLLPVNVHLQVTLAGD